MTKPEVADLLSTFAKRLATLADQALEAREQAHHVFQRINLLREELTRCQQRLMEEAKANR